MIFYVVVSSALMALALYARNRPQLSLFLFRACLPVVFAIVALRFEVGCDWGAYQYHFDSMTPDAFGDNLPRVEPGYWFVLDAIKVMGLPFETLNVVTSLLFFTGLYVFGRRQPAPMTVLAVVVPILVFALPMSAIRQAAAMGFVMMALVQFERRKLLLYVTLVGLGFLFHTSAILFLLLAPFIKIRVSVLNVLFMLPFVIGIGVIVSGLEGVEQASTRYVDNVANVAAGAPFRTTLLGATGLLFPVFLSRRWRHFTPGDYTLAQIGSGLMIATAVLVFVEPTIADRFGYYLIIIQAMLLARMEYLRVPGATLILTGFLFGMLAFFVLWWQLSWQLPYCYSPYQNIGLRALFGAG